MQDYTKIREFPVNDCALPGLSWFTVVTVGDLHPVALSRVYTRYMSISIPDEQLVSGYMDMQMDVAVTTIFCRYSLQEQDTCRRRQAIQLVAGLCIRCNAALRPLAAGRHPRQPIALCLDSLVDVMNDMVVMATPTGLLQPSR